MSLEDVKLPEVPKVLEQPRDDRGRFGPKRPLEFTAAHFWLEVGEIAVGVYLFQLAWEATLWLKSFLNL